MPKSFTGSRPLALPRRQQLLQEALGGDIHLQRLDLALGSAHQGVVHRRLRGTAVERLPHRQHEEQRHTRAEDVTTAGLRESPQHFGGGIAWAPDRGRNITKTVMLLPREY